MNEIAFGEEGFELLTDLVGLESAQADVAYVRQQRRLRGEPAMSQAEALHRAKHYLREEGSHMVAVEDTALPNGLQDLWIVSIVDPSQTGGPNDVICGGTVLAVTATGDVYPVSGLVPNEDEWLGVQFLPDDEEMWMLPEDWDGVLSEVLQGSGWSALMDFVDDSRRRGPVFPPAHQVFRAFELTPYEEVRVVLLGQDPYHGEGQANGLAFSVVQEEMPPSLRTIFRTLDEDPDVAPPPTGNLAGWAPQGVLLLNTVLTVDAGVANSHRGKGWEEFTDSVIRAVNDKDERVVFLLLGEPAQSKRDQITNAQHVVLSAAHPAAWATAKNPLVGSRLFSETNKALVAVGLEPIDWSAGATDT